MNNCRSLIASDFFDTVSQTPNLNSNLKVAIVKRYVTKNKTFTLKNRA